MPIEIAGFGVGIMHHHLGQRVEHLHLYCEVCGTNFQSRPFSLEEMAAGISTKCLPCGNPFFYLRPLEVAEQMELVLFSSDESMAVGTPSPQVSP